MSLRAAYSTMQLGSRTRWNTSRGFRAIICTTLACVATVSLGACEGSNSRPGEGTDLGAQDIPGAAPAGWNGEGAGWDGINRPNGEGYELTYLQGGWVVEADLSLVSFVVPDPLTHCASTTAAWANQAEQAERGVFAAINANFFECDVRNGALAGRSCPTAGEQVDPDGALAAEQFPIGVQCGEGNCFDNTEHKAAKYMSHFLVDGTGNAELRVYRGDGTPDPAPFDVPSGHQVPGAVSGAAVRYAVSGAPTIIRDGHINDQDTGWSSLYYYASLADAGTVPFIGIDYSRSRVYLGLVQGGARHAANELLRVFGGKIEHAMTFDAGGSPSFWFKGFAPVSASRAVPAKLALASANNIRSGIGRSACLEAAPTPSPPGPPTGGGSGPE